MVAIPILQCKAQQQLVSHSPAALPHPCAHPRLSIGLDHAYCPDCRRGFKPRTPEYQRAIAVEQRPPEHCSTRPPEKSKRHTPASGWVEQYPVKQGRYHYYRYCWQLGHKGKIEKLHIPSDSGKLAAVRAAINAGRCPQEISQMLKKCSGGRIKSPLTVPN